MKKKECCKEVWAKTPPQSCQKLIRSNRKQLLREIYKSGCLLYWLFFCLISIVIMERTVILQLSLDSIILEPGKDKPTFLSCGHT